VFDNCSRACAPLPDNRTAHWPRNVGATSFTAPNNKWHTGRCRKLPSTRLLLLMIAPGRAAR
jgi:hypothetical protein